MGYLSQRKKSQRENIFLKVSAIVSVILTLLSFVPVSLGVFPDMLFHFYVFNILFLVFSFYVGRFLYAGLFILLLTINYAHLATSANLFFDVRANAAHSLSLKFTQDSKQDLSDTSALVLRSGQLNLAGRSQARFWVVEKNSHAFSIIRVDFSKLNSKARRLVFKQLAAFIDTQDDPVIVYGRFGEAAWSKNLNKFLQESGLKIKNRLIFAENGSKVNLASIPSFYVLGFSNLGVEEISIDEPEGNKFPSIHLALEFE